MFSYQHIAFIIELLFLIFEVSSVLSHSDTALVVCVFDRASWVLLAYQVSAGNQDHRLALVLMVYVSCQFEKKVTFSRNFIIKISCIG